MAGDGTETAVAHRGALTTSWYPADTSVALSGHTVGSLLAERAGRLPDRLALVGTGHDGTLVRTWTC